MSEQDIAEALVESSHEESVGRRASPPKRPPQNKSIAWLRAVGGANGVVPFAMEGVGLDVDESELGV
jgi:hypothetical protein